MPRDAKRLPWNKIDTVMLDMDGTMLDLQFDNEFWRVLVPGRYAATKNISHAEAWEQLKLLFERTQGSLDWYCLDYWSRELNLDIVAMKHEVAHDIALLPGVERFLQRLNAAGKSVWLVTNAHADSLHIKLERTGIAGNFQRILSSHSLGLPKEHPQFWDRLQQVAHYDPAMTLFVDDTLPVLESAKSAGIAWLRAISQPDSTAPVRVIDDFVAVRRLAELWPEPARTEPE